MLIEIELFYFYFSNVILNLNSHYIHYNSIHIGRLRFPHQRLDHGMKILIHCTQRIDESLKNKESSKKVDENLPLVR